MLMEDRAEKSHGTENAEKSMSLGLQRVYNQKPWVSAVKKRGSRGSSSSGKRQLEFNDLDESRKKCKKEVSLSSLSNEKNNSKGASEVCKIPLNSTSTDSGNRQSREDSRVDGGSAGLGGISLNLTSSINIPKRPRDLVRRKKVEVDLSSKQEATSSSKASSAEGGGKLNGNADGTLSQNGSTNGKLAWNGEYEGTSNGSVIAKVKRRKNSHNHNENRSSSPNLLQHLKRDDSNSSLHNGDSVTKKARRTRKKIKETRTGSPALTVEVKQSLDESSRIYDDSLDDEENLEANAARMLSSRFDPSCTGFTSGGKSSKFPSANGFSALISSSKGLDTAHPDYRGESDIASSDAEARVLRPRDQQKGKGLSRKRRHFYEVVSRDLDSYWVLNRRIKVFWPLDQRWYLGHVIGYDLEKKLHHVEYDDCEEEWIDLQHERFKLFLLPNELPGQGGRKRSTEHSRKTVHGEVADAEKTNSSYMESEPIISWLARSTHRKSPPSGVRKKKRTLLGSAKSQSSSISEGKNEPQGSLEVGSSGRDAADFACSFALPSNSGDSLREKKLISENFLSNNDRAPIVYYRRRFHRREPSCTVSKGDLCKLSEKPRAYGNESDFVDSIDLGTDISLLTGECDHLAKRLSNNELIWDTDSSGLLKLIVPVTSLKVSKINLSFPWVVLTSSLVGWQNYMFLLQHGSLIVRWPLIHLEMLFIDNVVGLRFLLFEGCMKQAIPFVFLVLALFCQAGQREMQYDQQLPVTSVRLRFTVLQYVEKQLIFTFYNFSAISDSKWLYLDTKLKKHCRLLKQLPPSECTYDNIKALQNGCYQLKSTDVSQLPSSVMNFRRRSQCCGTSISSRQSACVKLSQLTYDNEEKLGGLPSFALSFSAAPTFFLSLHLRLLMERSIPSSSFREQDTVHLMDHPDPEGGLLGADRIIVEDNSMSSLSMGGNLVVPPIDRSELDSCSNIDLAANYVTVNLAEGMTTKPSHSFQDSPENEDDSVFPYKEGKAQLTEIEHSLSSSQPLYADNSLCQADNKVKRGPLNGMSIDIPSYVPVERNTDLQTIQNSIDLALGTNDGVCSPSPTASQIMWGMSKNGDSCSSASANISPGWTDGKQDFLRSGFGRSKKPRTQVSYSLPLGGQDYCTKNKFNHSKGFSHKRIRRANEKKASEAFGTCQRNMELLSCEANLLVIVGDRGWRECGAKIVLELFDHNEWKLAVKVLGDTRYSYKAHQFVQPGTTNRYTHVMMWKGGKDWILEFPDRSQWTIFKEMHEECYNRNFRAASVKNIPIPGVRLVDENDDNVPEVPFVRPSPKYYRQVETDIDIGMDPSRVLYDMDSDDERWMLKHRSLVFNERGCGDVSDEMFEKTIDVLEKFAYRKQRDRFSLDELEEEMAELGPLEATKMIYEHWRDKRQMKGMPLVRHLQPPLWEKYQQQVKEWEQAMAKSNLPLSSGSLEKPLTTEKPPMFAFCLKPRGLELPNRGSKQRSQKKLPVGALSNGIGDADAFHSLVGRRLNGLALGDDRAIYTAYNQGTSDSSPVLQGSTRFFSPRDSGAMGYFSLSSDGYERNHYPKLYRNKSKKLCFIPSSNDQQPIASYSQRASGNRSSVHSWNSSDWPNKMHYQPDGFQRHNFEQLDPSELDEFRLRDAASAARHAVTVAKMKREKAQRMLCRADLAMQKAVAAIMTADAVKASYKDPDSDDQTSG